MTIIKERAVFDIYESIKPEHLSFIIKDDKKHTSIVQLNLRDCKKVRDYIDRFIDRENKAKENLQT